MGERQTPAETRKFRRELRRHAEDLIAKMSPAVSIRIPLPSGQPGGRDAYLVVNGAAYKILGPGRYQLERDGCGVIVRAVSDRAANLPA